MSTKTELRQQVAEALVRVTNRWIAPNFPEDHKLREFAELEEQEQRLNLDYADAALGVLTVAQPVSQSLPAIPDDDADFTPDLARKIIAKYQQMLTAAQCAPQPSGEPVAWQYEAEIGDHGYVTTCSPTRPSSRDYRIRNVKPLYDHPESAVSCAAREALADLVSSLRQAESMLSSHIEEFHDFDYQPHEVPLELQKLRDIQHHLLGSLIDKSGELYDYANPALPAAGGEASKREADLREALIALRKAVKVYQFSPAGSVEASHAARDLDDALDASAALAVVPDERNTHQPITGERS